MVELLQKVFLLQFSRCDGMAENSRIPAFFALKGIRELK
jgi:hypothetical protein